jgi:hypothetical protein
MKTISLFQSNKTNKLDHLLPEMLMTWQKVADKTPAEDEMMIPVYLNRTRKNLIMSLKSKMWNKQNSAYIRKVLP